MRGDHLDALQRAKIRRTSRAGEAPGSETEGELNVVPFLDILVNVLVFVLATLAVTFTTVLEAVPAHREGPRLPAAPPLGLDVAVLRNGFVVSAHGQRLGAGCSAPGAGLAVGPAADGERDYDALTACARRLKAGAADGETDVVITAANDTPYDALVHTMDALRSDAAGELFPKVSFAVPR